jgi:hypothetical protein
MVHGLACWLARPIGYLTGQDDLEYLALAQALRQGSYHFLFRADAPLHGQYPPGYPAMLAVWGAVTGDGFQALVMLSVLVSVAALALTYVAVRRVFDPWIAIAALAALALNPSLVQFGGMPVSEAPFTLLAMLALVLLQREDQNRRYPVLIGATAILAALTRSIGILLIVAVGLHWMINRQWKRLFLLVAVSVVFVGGWLLWTVVAPEQHAGSSYVADVQASVVRRVASPNMVSSVLRRVTFYATNAVPHMLSVPTVAGTPIDNIASVALLAAGLFSGWWLLLRRWRPASLYLALYAGLLLVWMWASGRFLIPVVPVLVVALLAGLSVPFQRRWPGLASASVVVVAGLLVASGAVRTGAAVAERAGCRDWEGVPAPECVEPVQAGFFEALPYIRDNVPREDTVLVAKPGALWYYTGHLTTSYPEALAQGSDLWVPYLREHGVRWILLSEIEQGEFQYLLRLDENCGALAIERRFGDRTYLFRLIDDDQAGEHGLEGTGEACQAVKQFRRVVAGMRDST